MTGSGGGVPPNVQERSNIGENKTFSGAEAAATFPYLDRFLDSPLTTQI